MNQKKYNSCKRPDFRSHRTKLQWNLDQIYFYISTIAINFKNKTRHYYHSKHLHLSIQINHLLKSSNFYHKTYKINNINLHTELNIEMKINISAITINRPLLFLPFGNTQRNPHNLISCIKTRINLAGQKIILH